MFVNRTALNHKGVLRWQSHLLLTFVVAGVAASLGMRAGFLGRSFIGLGAAVFVPAVAIASAFAFLVWRLRAATPAAALTGGLCTFAFYVAAPGWHSLLWPLLVLFVLTFAATRFGRARKVKLHLAEDSHGRSASQVAANLGAAALATAAIAALHGFIILTPARNPLLSSQALVRVALVAIVAGFAEATADTLSSELGEVLGGQPVLLTTLRRVPAGTDGGISLAGTLAGCAGAAIIAVTAAAVLPLSWKEGGAATGAGIFGLFFDSLLGATLERRGWLNNDAVNFLSTCAAVLLGALLAAIG